MKWKRRKDDYSALSDEELLKIVAEEKSARAQLESFLTPKEEGGPDTAGSLFAERFRENGMSGDYIQARDKELKRLQKQLKEASFNAAAAQSLLDERGMESIYGSKSEFDKAKSLTGLLSPTSGLAGKGYDVGGYGGFASIEQQQLAKQTEIALHSKMINEETKRLTLVSQNLYNYLINRDMIQKKRIGADWQ